MAENRLKEKYIKEIAPELMKLGGYKNINEVPKLEKIVLNMGLGDVKLMGALGLFFGWRMIIIISLMAFLLGAIIGICLIITKKKTSDDYIPFGPFIVIAALIAIFIPFDILLTIMWNIFTLGTIK